MALWLVRAGSTGQRQDYALDNNVAVIGWDSVPDLRQFKEKDQLRHWYQDANPLKSVGFISNHVGQLWAFSKRISIGDLIALPLKHQDAIAFGRAAAPYRFDAAAPEGARHQLPVTWIVQDLPRARLEQDLLYSLGAFMTVCRIQRNNAEPRVRAILEGKAVPRLPEPVADETEATDETTATPDLAAVAADQIKAFMGQRFTGHALADVVAAVLHAQGYKTLQSEPGPDGGIDIIAGRGPLGFDEPRLVVQVKGGDAQQDIKVVRELKGVMHDYNAQQGLFVAWGGFRRSVWQEARQRFFEIRLWEAKDVIAAVEEHYDFLPETLRAELPLKRIWTLVQEDAE